MIVYVFHAKNPNFGFASEDRPEQIWPRDFTLVAIVNLRGRLTTTAIEEAMIEAYRATNHIEQDWTCNDEVSWATPVDSPRSTSVGDVYVIDTKIYQIENDDWTDITDKGQE